MRFTARAPATETPAPAAPAVAVADAVLLASAGVVPTAGIFVTPALTVRLVAWTESVGPTDAVLVPVSSVIATPAPTRAPDPSALPPADPSAFVTASVFAVERIVTSVPAVIASEPTTNPADDDEVARSTATAAATLIEPPEVCAKGVGVAPAPDPPWLDELVDA